MGCVGFLTHLLTSFVFPKFHSKMISFHWKKIIISPINASLSMIFNNLKYGVLLIDSHIFFLEVLIKCSSKEFPITLWKLLLELVLTEVIFQWGFGMVGWTNFGITGVFVFAMAMIANVISYYICWGLVNKDLFSNNKL